MRVIKLEMMRSDLLPTPDKHELLEKMLCILAELEVNVFCGTLVSSIQKVDGIIGSALVMSIHIDEGLDSTSVAGIIRIIRAAYNCQRLYMSSRYMKMNDEGDWIRIMKQIKTDTDVRHARVLTTRHAKWERFNTLIEAWGPKLEIYTPPETAKPMICVSSPNAQSP